MVSNKQLLDVLYDLGAIDIESPKLIRAPERLPKDLSWDKVEGMLLGLAIGDSLGNTSESLTWQHRAETFDWIYEYEPNPRFGNKARGFPSDDTQMAFWLLEHLNRNGCLLPDKLAKTFVCRDIFGMGQSVREFRKNYREVPWYFAASLSAGNGALMRIAPIMVPWLKNPSNEMWADTILAASLTHNDRASTASCIALVSVLWEIFRWGDKLLTNPSRPFSEWIVDNWCSTMEKYEGTETDYGSRSENTSKTCNMCKNIGNRNGKKFKCPHCGHTSHADINAAFNISEWEVEGIAPKDTMKVA